MRNIPYKFLLLSLLTLILQSCMLYPPLSPEIAIFKRMSSQPEIVKVETYDNNTHSRIRIYYDDVNIQMYENITCTAWKNNSIKNYIHTVKNSLPNNQIITVGMPQTEKSYNLLTVPQKKWGLKVTFKEFIIDANQPIIVDAHHSDVSKSCQIAASFTPKAGEDYEISYREGFLGEKGTGSRYCTLNLQTINKDKQEHSELLKTQDSSELTKCK